MKESEEEIIVKIDENHQILIPSKLRGKILIITPYKGEKNGK